ncbi:MAG: helix-turn-helix transcriptional regulator [Deferribacteres bacterium]|nr:helix-turn-helix transcriptional regulator [Deferribacteres bacterium]
MSVMQEDLVRIRRLIGSVDKEQLRHVDCFIGENVGIFMPVGGACFYALTPLHSHPSYMFVLAFDERTSFDIQGKVLSVEPGRLFSLSPGIVHHELPSDFPPRYMAVFIDREFFEQELVKYPVGNDITFHGEFSDAASGLLPLLQRFIVESGNRLPGFETVLEALSLEICHSIIRSIFRFTSEACGISSRMEIDRAVKYLHINIAEKISVEKLAEIAHMSPSHFSRTFKHETGRSPMDYLSLIRTERAKKLLVAGDKSITDIAFECGFNNVSYLSACFKKKYKITPSAYRKSLRKGIISKKNS